MSIPTPRPALTNTAVVLKDRNASADLTLTDLFCGAGGSSTGAIAGPRRQRPDGREPLGAGGRDPQHQPPRRRPRLRRHVPGRPAPLPPHRHPVGLPGVHEPLPGQGPQADHQASPTCSARRCPTRPPNGPGRRCGTSSGSPSTTATPAVIVENVVDAVQVAAVPGVAAGDGLPRLRPPARVPELACTPRPRPAGAAVPRPDVRGVLAQGQPRARPRPPTSARSAWCPRCDQVVRRRAGVEDRADRWGRYRQQYVYRCPHHRLPQPVVEPGWLPAAAAIDWTLPGQRIGDRAKPLAAKTRRGSPPGSPGTGHRSTSRRPGTPTTPPTPSTPSTATRAATTAPGPSTNSSRPSTRSSPRPRHPLAVPVEGRDGKQAQPLAAALRTQTTRLETALVVPAGGTWNDDARPRHRGAAHPHHPRERSRRRALAHRRAPRRRLDLRPASDPSGHRHRGREPPRPRHPVLRQRAQPRPPATRCHGHDRRPARARDAEQHRPRRPRPDDHARPRADPDADGEGAPVAADPRRPRRRRGAGRRRPVPDARAREVVAAMAFPGDYVVLGNRREQVRMAGNAVTPPAARDLVGAVAKSLGVRRERRPPQSRRGNRHPTAREDRMSVPAPRPDLTPDPSRSRRLPSCRPSVPPPTPRTPRPAPSRGSRSHH